MKVLPTLGSLSPCRWVVISSCCWYFVPHSKICNCPSRPTWGQNPPNQIKIQLVFTSPERMRFIDSEWVNAGCQGFMPPADFPRPNPISSLWPFRPLLEVTTVAEFAQGWQKRDCTLQDLSPKEVVSLLPSNPLKKKKNQDP